MRRPRSRGKMAGTGFFTSLGGGREQLPGVGAGLSLSIALTIGIPAIRGVGSAATAVRPTSCMSCRLDLRSTRLQGRRCSRFKTGHYLSLDAASEQLLDCIEQ